MLVLKCIVNNKKYKINNNKKWQQLEKSEAGDLC